MLPDGRSRPNVTWQPASQVGFEAIGVASSGLVATRAVDGRWTGGKVRAAHCLSSEVWPRVVRQDHPDRWRSPDIVRGGARPNTPGGWPRLLGRAALGRRSAT